MTLSSDLAAKKITTFPGINDQPKAPTTTEAGNGSHLIKQFNDLIDLLSANELVSSNILVDEIISKINPNSHVALSKIIDNSLLIEYKRDNLYLLMKTILFLTETSLIEFDDNAQTIKIKAPVQAQQASNSEFNSSTTLLLSIKRLNSLQQGIYKDDLGQDLKRGVGLLSAIDSPSDPPFNSPGSSYVFSNNNKSAYIESHGLPNKFERWSLEFMLKIDSAGSGTLFAFSSEALTSVSLTGWTMKLEIASSALVFSIKNASTDATNIATTLTSTALTLDRWTYVAIGLNSSNLVIMLDGVQDKTIAAPNLTTFANRTMGILGYATSSCRARVASIRLTTGYFRVESTIPTTYLKA